MVTYPSEPELVLVLDHHDELVRQCAAGALSFGAFCAAYDNFYWAYALDGHESDAAGQALLGRLAARVAPHRALAETVLAHIHPETLRVVPAMARPAGSTPMRPWCVSSLSLLASFPGKPDN